MSLLVYMAAAFALSAGVLAGLTMLFKAPVSEPFRIRPEDGRKIKNSNLYRLMALNTLLSAGILFGCSYLAYGRLYYEGPLEPLRLLLEVGGILLLYDFLYYIAHRFLLHGPIKFMYRVHLLHHTAKYPQATDSLYVHPLETSIGLALLMGSTWAVGPVHVISFSVLFLIYSVMNIVIHGGLRMPAFPLRAFDYMARKHDVHHISVKSGNYASITPIFDIMFGTAESPPNEPVRSDGKTSEAR